jgi:hypothetical protein
MPNLKALRKLMQEEGLLRQVKKIPDGTAYQLEKALRIKRNPEKLNDPNFLDDLSRLSGERLTKNEALSKMQDSISSARRARNEGYTTPGGLERLNYPYDETAVADYPHYDDIDLNKKIRKDLEWAAGKEKGNFVFDDAKSAYEHDTLPPSRRNNPARDDEFEYPYESRVDERHVKNLQDKWSQIRSLLEKKKSE